MTFKQYTENPMGKQNAVFSQRDMFKNLYTEKFDKVLLREAGKINFTLYMDKKHDEYYAHIKIPSETVKDFYYDAVIMFFSNDPVAKSSSTLSNYNVRFFSNDPAFVFTYLRVFLKNDLFIEDLKPKASKQALKQDPKIRNPYEVPGYSKILYFAYLFMQSKNLFSKAMYTTYAEKFDKKKLMDNVVDADTHIAKRQAMGEQQKKDEKKEAKKAEKASIQPRQVISPMGNMRMTKSVGTVGPSRTVKRTGNVKTVKRTNKK